ncbi:hypothetical protein P3T36_006546 [Kitasatospora sp. MAP12-15]|uniref:hypothetical protein n=1 Tax=unclassified Kitasatospora TaxID=2633591 RepID=UPI0024730E63|nr:hypothetical protein [Kitasatospora sp. MAP12-44]MDH6113183.1 hypothetical protein [Kitasatospora sp. MAP12-44]
MSNYQQNPGPSWTAPAPYPQEPAAPSARLLGPVNWRVVRLSIPISALALGLITVLAWPSIKTQVNPPVAMHRLVPPPTVTLRGQLLKSVPAAPEDRPGTDAETQATGRNKQLLGLVRLDATYSPDGTRNTPPGYQIFAGYGNVADPAQRMDEAVANIKLAGATQLGPMKEYAAKGKNSGDVPIRCAPVSISATSSVGWCTWANRSSVGTVTLISLNPGGPTPDDLSQLAADTATLRDSMYVAP